MLPQKPRRDSIAGFRSRHVQSRLAIKGDTNANGTVDRLLPGASGWNHVDRSAMTMVTLIAKEIVYFSPSDESSFFAWLKGIGCVSDIRGAGRELHMKVRPPIDTELRELIALFHRYGVEQRQLAQFVTPKNALWFRDDDAAYWHAAIFKEA